MRCTDYRDAGRLEDVKDRQTDRGSHTETDMYIKQIEYPFALAVEIRVEPVGDVPRRGSVGGREAGGAAPAAHQRPQQHFCRDEGKEG